PRITSGATSTPPPQTGHSVVVAVLIGSSPVPGRVGGMPGAPSGAPSGRNARLRPAIRPRNRRKSCIANALCLIYNTHMIRISDAVRHVVEHDPAIRTALAQRLLNLSQVARHIHAAVEARTQKPVR